jgi:hypothetical protein
LRDAGRRRTAVLQLAEERARAQRLLDAWAFEVVPGVMDLVARACVARARELAVATGYAIDVTYPVRTATGPKDAFPLHVVAIRLEPVEVDVYSARGPGGLPVLHVVSFLRDASQRERRLVSEPGCLVSRGADSGWQLLSLDPPRAATTVDDLVHRAFARLVRHWTTGPVCARVS